MTAFSKLSSSSMRIVNFIRAFGLGTERSRGLKKTDLWYEKEKSKIEGLGSQ